MRGTEDWNHSDLAPGIATAKPLPDFGPLGLLAVTPASSDSVAVA